MTDQNKEQSDESRSFWKYLAAANATHGGSIIMLLIGLAVGFPWGYYTKYKSYKSDGAQIVNQAVNNQRLDKASEIQMERRSNDLTQTLRSMGYTQAEIDFLVKGDVTLLNQVKDVYSRFTGNGIYKPREDCQDDYLGKQAADEVNQAIRDRFAKKPDGSNED